MTISQHTCRICSAVGNHPIFVGREMMFGTREEFEYFQCTECGCLQILKMPDNIERYYPANYNAHNIKMFCERNKLRAFLLKQRFRNALFNQGYKVNKLLSYLVTMVDLRIDGVLPISKVLKIGHVKDFSARFLDVGCGNWSKWLQDLRAMGFRNLVGIDPFISSNLEKCGIRILRQSIAQAEGQFDLITFHHSLEHILNQQEILTDARRLLAPNGVILIRIPIVSSYVWEKYGVNWIEMDPPRHLYLHSKESIKLLGQQAGLELFETLYDSYDFEFYGSEQYLRDIPLVADASYWKDQNSSTFSKQEMAAFQALAAEVNRKGVGGRAAFFFRARSS